MRGDVTVYPGEAEFTGEHDLDGLDCWCSPAYLLPCDECEAGCWKCTDGTIPLTRSQAEAADRPLIIVHNR